MERVGDRQGKIETYCSTGQSPQRAVAPMEEQEKGTVLQMRERRNTYKILVGIAL
jgi:hypothetical protein